LPQLGLPSHVGRALPRRWRTTLGPGSYLARQGAATSSNIELQSNQYYGGTGRGYLPLHEPQHRV